MLKYDYKKIIAKMQEKHINIKDLIEHPAMYRWNASAVAEVLKGQRAVPERLAKEIEQKMHLKDNQVWEIIVGKEIFTKSIAKGIAKLYNLSDNFFLEDGEKSKCCFLGEQCRILNDTKCASRAFFKTKEQFIKDREEAKQKLINEKKWDYFVEKYPILKGI